MMDFERLRDSSEYRSMFMTIIKYQIQSLVTQLSNAGIESVLLTACPNSSVHIEEDVIGSDLGLSFLQDRADCLTVFKDYCFMRSKPQECQVADTNKRRMSESTLIEPKLEPGTDDSNSNDMVCSDEKRIKIERVSTPESATDPREATPASPYSIEPSNYSPAHVNASFSGSNLWSPSVTNLMSQNKSQHKCSQCSYTSKFKANVVRHERSIHGINADNSFGPTIQYACTLCTYKSLYRSNLMRHEKNVHKLEPVPQETDFHRMGIPTLGDFSALSAVKSTETGLSKESSQPSLEHSSQTEKLAEVCDNTQETADGCHVCSFCQLVYPTTQSLKEHIDQAHYRSGKYDCGKCRMTFDNQIAFQAHMATHYITRQEKCICGRTFQYRVSLLKHIPKCVIAKETNFKMSDVVLGSGIEMESIYNRIDSEQGISNTQTEQVVSEKKSKPGASLDCELDNRADTEQGTIKQESKTGYQFFLSKPENEHDQRWCHSQGAYETAKGDNYDKHWQNNCDDVQSERMYVSDGSAQQANSEQNRNSELNRNSEQSSNSVFET